MDNIIALPEDPFGVYGDHSGPMDYCNVDYFSSIYSRLLNFQN